MREIWKCRSHDHFCKRLNNKKYGLHSVQHTTSKRCFMNIVWTFWRRNNVHTASFYCYFNPKPNLFRTHVMYHPFIMNNKNISYTWPIQTQCAIKDSYHSNFIVWTFINRTDLLVPALQGLGLLFWILPAIVLKKTTFAQILS